MPRQASCDCGKCDKCYHRIWMKQHYHPRERHTPGPRSFKELGIPYKITPKMSRQDKELFDKYRKRFANAQS